MKRIKLNENIQFSKCRVDSQYQYCSYCGKKIGKGNFGLSIIKKCSTRLNVWIHLNCIEKFCKDLLKFKKDSMRKIILGSLK